jgi:hypothetical protein
VVDQSHLGVGLCRWCLSGLFARHAEFAWQDKHGSAPVSRSRACGQASEACKRCPNVRQPRRTSRPTDLRNPATPPANSRPQGTSRGDLVARPVRRGVHYLNGRCVGDPVMLGDVRKDVGGSDATGYGGSTP